MSAVTNWDWAWQVVSLPLSAIRRGFYHPYFDSMGNFAAMGLRSEE